MPHEPTKPSTAEAEHGSHADDQKRLPDELPQDVTARRAHGPPDPDLPRALPHHDVHDVRDADPADRQREAPDDGEEDVEREEHVAETQLELDRVPHPQGVLVVRVEAVAPSQGLVHAPLDGLGGGHVARPVDEVVHVRIAEHCPVGRRGNEDAVRVARVVGRVLRLRLHHADHGERCLPDEHLLPDRVRSLEQEGGQPVPQHRDAPPLGDVQVVEEAATRSGDDVAHLAVHRQHAGDVRVRGVRAVPDGGPAVAVLRAQLHDVGDLTQEELPVVLPQADVPAFGEPLETHGGPAAEEDHDPVAQAVEPLLCLSLEPHPEREEDHHRDGPPRDAEHGERRAQPLGADVRHELPNEAGRAHGAT